MADDPLRIPKNVQKMLDLGAPEVDVDEYLKTEGLTPEQFAATHWQVEQPPAAPVAAEPKVGTGTDILESLASGGIKGAIGLAGMPSDLFNMVNSADRALGRWLYKNLPEGVRDALAFQNPPEGEPERLGGGSADIMHLYEQSGLRQLHKPQTGLGQFAETAGEYMLPGSIARRAETRALGTALGLLGAGGATAAGHYGEQAGLSPGWQAAAEAAGGLTGMLGPAAALQHVGNAGRLLKRSMQGMSGTDWNQAFARQQAGQDVGVPLMGPQSVGPVNTASDPLQTLAGNVRAAPSTARQMNEALQQQNTAALAAGRQEIGQLAPTVAGEAASPVEAGLGMQEGAQEAIRTRRKERTRMAQPAYEMAESKVLSPTAQRSIGLAIANALPKVLGTQMEAHLLRLAKTLAGSPTVGAMHNVVKQIREAVYPTGQLQQALNSPGATAQGIVGPILDGIMGTMEHESKLFELGNWVYRRMTPHVQELTKRQVGKIERTTDPEEIAGIIIDPKRSRPEDVQLAAAVIIPRRPGAWRELARTYLENMFEGSMAGRFAGGGATFARKLLADPRTGANVREFLRGAAIDAKLDPGQVVAGWEKLLTVLERTDKIPGSGSQTAVRLGTEKELGKTALSEGVRLDRRLGEWWSDFINRRAYRQLADAFTAPESLQAMRRLARLRPASPLAVSTALGMFQAARTVIEAQQEAPLRLAPRVGGPLPGNTGSNFDPATGLPIPGRFPAVAP